MIRSKRLAGEMLEDWKRQHGQEPRLGCSLVAHRDLGFCAGCRDCSLATEISGWRLLAMAERGVPDQTSEEKR